MLLGDSEPALPPETCPWAALVAGTVGPHSAAADKELRTLVPGACGDRGAASPLCSAIGTSGKESPGQVTPAWPRPWSHLRGQGQVASGPAGVPAPAEVGVGGPGLGVPRSSACTTLAGQEGTVTFALGRRAGATQRGHPTALLLTVPGRRGGGQMAAVLAFGDRAAQWFTRAGIVLEATETTGCSQPGGPHWGLLRRRRAKPTGTGYWRLPAGFCTWRHPLTSGALSCGGAAPPGAQAPAFAKDRGPCDLIPVLTATRSLACSPGYVPPPATESFHLKPQAPTPRGYSLPTWPHTSTPSVQAQVQLAHGGASLPSPTVYPCRFLSSGEESQTIRPTVRT